MLYLELSDVIELHEDIMAESGGASGIRDWGGLESALALPQMEMFGESLYQTLVEKAAILGFALVANHPFIDGNKRIGHAVMETFLFLNGHEIEASVDEQEQIILKIAAGEMSKEEFAEWLKNRTVHLIR